jgi:hypothetical protein
MTVCRSCDGRHQAGWRCLYRVMSYKSIQAPELSIGSTASSQEEYTVYSGSSYQTNSLDSSIYSNYTKNHIQIPVRPVTLDNHLVCATTEEQ